MLENQKKTFNSIQLIESKYVKKVELNQINLTYVKGKSFEETFEIFLFGVVHKIRHTIVGFF